MKLIYTAASVVDGWHARSNTVTASIDRLDFLGPVFVGDLLFLKASRNMAGKTSMELGVRWRLKTSSPARSGTPLRLI